MQRDSGRTRIWFPLFSFFESDVDGIVPNEYESPFVVIHKVNGIIKQSIKHIIFLIQANLTMKSNATQSSPTSIHASKKHKKKVN